MVMIATLPLVVFINKYNTKGKGQRGAKGKGKR
jgi:hypothetical protein